MKQLESETGLPIYKLFDFICGVSTGSLIAVMIGAFKVFFLDICHRFQYRHSTLL